MLPYTCWTMELAGPLPCCTRATSLIVSLLFGSTTVAIPLDDMFERGGPTNVLEDRKFFKEEIFFLRTQKNLKN